MEKVHRQKAPGFLLSTGTRWRGGSARTIGKYKFFWMGCEEETAGVGFLGAEKHMSREAVEQSLIIFWS